MIKKGLVFILLFSYIYQISYFFLPFNTPFMLGFLGISQYVYKNILISNKDRVFVSDILLSLLPVAFVALLSILVNLSFDFYFVKWAIINALYFFGGYFVVQLLMDTYKKFSFSILVDHLVLCAVVQLFLAIIMSLFPSVSHLLQSIVTESDVAKDALIRTEGTRLVGFGTHFFLSATVHSFILIMIAFSFLFEKKSYIKSVILFLSFIFIAAVGIMMARTTIVGVALALIIFMFVHKGKSYLLYGITFSVIIVFILSKYFLSSLYEDLDAMIQFGLQPVLNYMETGSFSTHSTESQISMYKFPSTFETWLIGDGFYETANGYYYMNTDIGYCRLLFYFGIIGFITYMWFEYYVLKKIFPKRVYGNIVWIVLFCFVVILNGKGTFDIFPYVCLFSFCVYSCKSNKDNEKTLFNLNF